MILSDLVIPSRVNLQCEFSGIDSLKHCLNKDHFRSYPHPVDYVYNSRGFRDSEWPESLAELKDAIWCVGDSFTVGIGSPYNFTWPQVLSAATGRRCINVSMDGASNNWISRRAQQVVKEVAPIYMAVMWSYTHRSEYADIVGSDEQRRNYGDQSKSGIDDLENFIKCYSNLKKFSTHTSVFNGAIPDFCQPYLMKDGPDISVMIQDWKNIRGPDWPSDPPISKSKFNLLPDQIKNEIITHAPTMIESFDSLWGNFTEGNQLVRLPILDHARDWHHFDIITSKFLVEKICNTLFFSNHGS